ncbi:unnamed protein product [Cyclocybe aegerita]|uniref:Uncharacterized protein n=1 Tax=Cyclocybe aegerita TaxID=1973307 RepID=A0A8S0W252_CYCAE|nr:unnamed protein product [Cyclocybe aegerita]
MKPLPLDQLSTSSAPNKPCSTSRKWNGTVLDPSATNEFLVFSSPMSPSYGTYSLYGPAIRGLNASEVSSVTLSLETDSVELPLPKLCLMTAGSVGGSIGPEIIRFIIAWNVIQAVALGILSAIILTVLFSPIRRSATWILFVSSGIVTAASYLLLVMRQVGPDPPRTLCVIQAMLVYACPPFNAVCAFSFMLQLLVDKIAQALRNRILDNRFTRGNSILVLAAPFVVFGAIPLEVSLFTSTTRLVSPEI